MLELLGRSCHRVGAATMRIGFGPGVKFCHIVQDYGGIISTQLPSQPIEWTRPAFGLDFAQV
jgi:hypothetical protein